MVLSEWGRYKMVLWVGEIQDGTVLVEEIQYGTVWVGGDTRWYCLSVGRYKMVLSDMVRTGLEKSWNLTLDLKSHWILCSPGKMEFCLEKSLKISGSHWKISMCHVKLNLNMKTLMIIWSKVSFCHYIWDQIGETMLSDLLSRATCYIVADSWTTCYIVAVKPSQAAYAGKASMIKASLPLTVSDEVLVVQKTTSYRKKIKWISGKSFFNQQCKYVCLIMILSMDNAHS